MDERANFAISELTAGIASGVTSLTLSDASLFPTPTEGYNAVLWDSSVYGNPAKDANVEIVRVTEKSTNTLTITRGQESTADVNHNTGGHTYSLAISLTEKTLDDIETLIAGKADALGGDENYVTDAEKSALHAAGGDTALGTQAENLDMGTHKIVGVVDPTANQEAATKKYVDDNEPTLPVKATGAEIDTGTDDVKFVTPKAVEDSGIAKVSEIPVKATGAEVDTGSDDVKFVTPKAVADSKITQNEKTQTLTNKRNTPREGHTTSSATPTINTDNYDMYQLTAQAAAITSFTTNLSGTPTVGQKLWITITGTAARAISWGTSFEASTTALPTTTVTTARLDVGFVYNSVTSKWRIVATA